MVGLVFAETLRLTPLQWLALGLNAAGWLWCYRHSQLTIDNCQLSIVNHWGLPALLTFSGLWIAFWKTPTSIDQQMLFEQARYLSRFSWSVFVEQFSQRPYVEYQPPFLTFWLSRTPVFWLHQLVLLPFGLLCAGLMWRLYGRTAALLLATPVFALMVHQPCTDTVLFGVLLMVLRLCQMARAATRLPTKDAKRHEKQTHRSAEVKNLLTSQLLNFFFSCRSCVSWAAAVLYGLTWLIKPLTLLTAPFILPQLGRAGIGSLAMWGGYVWWSQRWEFGRRQFRFLLHQLLISSLKRTGTGRVTPPRASRPLWVKLVGTLRWRWAHLGRNAAQALPLYVFPTYLRPWTWQGIVLAGMMVFGYGNMKYLLFDLLFVFPVIEEE